MKARLITVSVTLALLAAWAGKVYPTKCSWPDGH
jgi:hypothetical protein